MPLSNTVNNRVRRVVAWLICAALLLLGSVVVGVKYFHMKDILLDSTRASAAALPAGWPDDGALASLNLKVLGKPSLWNAANLSDKINGKAELYLGAGFKSMTSGRFAFEPQPDLWFEAQLFEQSTEKSAFAVFSQQRRGGGEALPFIAHGYSTSNALYLQYNNFYLEITAAGTDQRLRQAMLAWSQYWLEKQPRPDGENKTDSVPAFAGEGLQPGSIMLLAKDAFGLAGFDQVWLAGYEKGGHSITLFLHNSEDAPAAVQLARKLREFWLMQGALETKAPTSAASVVAGLQCFELEGFYQLLYVKDSSLIGIHEADSLEDAALLLLRQAPLLIK